MFIIRNKTTKETTRSKTPVRDDGSGLAYLIQTTAAAVTPTWTGVSSGGCVMAVFKP